MIGRIVIDDIRPRTPTGMYPAKAVVGEAVRVTADIFRDGHDLLAARVCWRPTAEAAGAGGASDWSISPMFEVGNDRWESVVVPTVIGMHDVVVEAWTDRWSTWRHRVSVKRDAGDDLSVELEEGARLLDERAAHIDRGDRTKVPDQAGALRDAADVLRTPRAPLERRLAPAFDAGVTELMAGPSTSPDRTRAPTTPLWVDRPRALVGAWYELFPRSEGGLAGSVKRLDAVADMGFDVVYLAPIHPIGTTSRKGADNTLESGPGDPGSPWAIGGPDGGHTAVAPELGTVTDLQQLMARAAELGIEIALDYALQCSPDHPWVHEHPEWFHHRPDGSVAYAENPPKKYQDIFPINFWPSSEADRWSLWQACRGVLEHWIGLGVRIFRVDNPHTKPMALWEWLIPTVKATHPDVIFLAEAFTRPKVMAKLAEVGFSQSYTYFTWRNEAWELREYLQELTAGPVADYMRPSFWPNTPDILSGPLRRGPPAAFKMRLVLAATMVPSYGIYSGYELFENEPASDTNEEYSHSEKYEIKRRDWSRPDSLAPWIGVVNSIRRRHPAFWNLRNLTFHHSTNSQVLAYSKQTDDRSDVVLMVVNLDPSTTQESTLGLDLGLLGLGHDELFEAVDELTGKVFGWSGPNPYVRLDPSQEPAHVLHLRRRR
ncbi:MAG: alpha-1,4-glucan--maltose-1-phosphate maltosyltransferase [Actinobacteria bacterium]|nr:MAG: alpha-1,4-glucan--maltose-1-phosphate maltosyltransferase [Actinomycetota bacterium]